LHLFIKDIFAATKATRGRAVADCPPGYPFVYLLEFISKCKDRVKFFNNHHAPKAQLKSALSAAKLKMLAQMDPTRWGSIKKMAETMLAAEAILQQLVPPRDFVSGNAKQNMIRQAVHDKITSKEFLDLLKMTLSILNPIDIAITYYPSDSVPMSDVFATFSNELPRSITALTTITYEELSYMRKLNQHRFDFIYGDAHGIGYVLDPRYVGEGMPLAMRESIENLIYLYHCASDIISESDVGPPDQTSQERMVEEYIDYRIAALEQKAANPPSLMFRMIKEKKISVIKFWQSRGDQWPALQKLAQQVFSMVAPRAASERNFSTQGFVHSKLRNFLSEDAVEKLVYIKTNNIQFCNQTRLSAVLHAVDEDDDNTNKSTDWYPHYDRIENEKRETPYLVLLRSKFGFCKKEQKVQWFLVVF
jgi:hAT family C-terminal dimerisation region